MTVNGIVQNGQIVLEPGVSLPEGAKVKVVAEITERPPQTAKELLQQFAGCMTDLPSDLARNHDHYLHGTPKQ